MDNKIKWDEETGIVVVGYDGAGAVAAITAYDTGVKVLIREKHISDTTVVTKHILRVLLELQRRLLIRNGVFR